jgi:predicted RNase H-like HicB family nuclease
MLKDYIEAAIKRAEYKKLDDGTWFGEIPGFQGVWANGDVLEVCRMELIEVLEEWLLLKIKDGDSLPIIDGLKISVEKIAG